MKLSVSLPDDDVEFLDAYAEQFDMPSRSAALQRAVRLLRDAGLGSDYEAAWHEWDASDESSVWVVTIDDGIGT